MCLTSLPSSTCLNSFQIYVRFIPIYLYVQRIKETRLINKIECIQYQSINQLYFTLQQVKN